MGSTFSLPFIRPILTQPMGPAHGCLESINAREAAFTAAIAGSNTPSKCAIQLWEIVIDIFIGNVFEEIAL